MPRSPWELADVFRRYGAAFRQVAHATLSLMQTRVMTAIETCRTAALGGHVDVCDSCGFSSISYNSCRNRHCPKCQGAARQTWLAERESELLPVPYFHVVFTVPSAVADLALFNKRCLYEILFKTASQSLLRLAQDPKRLGARIGFLAILHTWGRNLLHHPHVHCVVPGGGLSKDRTRWITTRKPGYLLSIEALSSLFRGKFTAELKSAFDAGKLSFPSSLSPLADSSAFDLFLSRLRSQPWVVYCKPPFGGPQQVLRYLGRYTHRVALSNDSILAIDDGKVSFRFKDYRDGNRVKVMTLDATEFIRRFLLHVLPDSFQRIRHYGFLANRSRKRSITLCRRLISEAQAVAGDHEILPTPAAPLDSQPAADSSRSPRACPVCQTPLRTLELPRTRALVPPVSLAEPARISDPSRASPVCSAAA
jgi:putative transposase/transposase-like zinc-binding protein